MINNICLQIVAEIWGNLLMMDGTISFNKMILKIISEIQQCRSQKGFIILVLNNKQFSIELSHDLKALKSVRAANYS